MFTPLGNAAHIDCDAMTHAKGMERRLRLEFRALIQSINILMCFSSGQVDVLRLLMKISLKHLLKKVFQLSTVPATEEPVGETFQH